MILEALIFLLTTIIFYYLYSYKKLHGYFKERGVKFLPGVPLFGNIARSTFLTRHFLDDLEEVYNAFPEERYVGFLEMTAPILLIRDPELIKCITVKDFDHFVDHKQFFNEHLDPLFGGSLLLMKGDRWRDMRTTLSPAFTASKMKYMLPFILEITNNIIEYLNEIWLAFFPNKVYDFFTNIVASTIELRKKKNITRPDMIQLLMEAKQEWNLNELVSQVFIFFSAGFETSASALVMTVHELALYPSIQNKLYQECKQFKEEKELTFDSLAELKYLDCVITETLRKWSPAIILDRTCTKTYELPPPREGGEPYVLHPGDIVYNMVNQLHMDAKYYPDPHKYDPERFSEENKHNNKAFTYMPFGIGPRVCIGQRFAMMELKVLLYSIILNFKIVKTAETMDPVKMMTSSFNIKVPGGTKVQFETRLEN